MLNFIGALWGMLLVDRQGNIGTLENDYLDLSASYFFKFWFHRQLLVRYLFHILLWAWWIYPSCEESKSHNILSNDLLLFFCIIWFFGYYYWYMSFSRCYYLLFYYYLKFWLYYWNFFCIIDLFFVLLIYFLYYLSIFCIIDIFFCIIDIIFLYY